MNTVSSSPATSASGTAANANANTNQSPGPNTRSGKIARLPAHIQEDLNHRLANHQPARVILPWLNGLQEVKTLLKEAFNDKRINEQNLSNWRRGGFHEWQYRQKYFACFRNVARDAADIESTVGNLTEHAARLLALQFSLVLCPPVALRGHSDVPDVPPAIINTFCKIARAISSLRRGDHAAARLKLQEQQQAHPQKSTPPQPPLKVNQAKSSLLPTPAPRFPSSPDPPPGPSPLLLIVYRPLPIVYSHSPPPTEHRAPYTVRPPAPPSVPFNAPRPLPPAPCPPPPDPRLPTPLSRHPSPDE